MSRRVRFSPNQAAELERRLEDALQVWALEELGVALCATLTALYLPYGSTPNRGGACPPLDSPDRASLPGSVRRVATMRSRAERGLSLYHPADGEGCRAPWWSDAAPPRKPERDDRKALKADRLTAGDLEAARLEALREENLEYLQVFTARQKDALRRRLEPLRRLVAPGHHAALLEDLLPRRVVRTWHQRYLFPLGDDLPRTAPPAAPAWVPPEPPPWLFGSLPLRKGRTAQERTLPEWTLAGRSGVVWAASAAEARAEFRLLLGLKKLPPGARVERVRDEVSPQPPVVRPDGTPLEGSS